MRGGPRSPRGADPRQGAGEAVDDVGGGHSELADLAARFGAEREIVIARELTKKFEEVARLPLGEAHAWLEARPGREQGEFVLVLAPGEERSSSALDAGRVLEVLLEALAPTEAAKLAARITGLPKSELYRKSLKSGKGGAK